MLHLPGHPHFTKTPTHFTAGIIASLFDNLSDVNSFELYYNSNLEAI